MRRKTMLFACALLLSVFARAQWNGYEVKTIGTTPATTLNSGYYALFQNGHKGFAYLSETMLNLWGNNYNLAKNRIASNSPGISAFADLTRNIATNPAPNDRRWYVFKITNNGDGTCTIQCADGTYFPALGRRIPLVSSATPGVFTFHNHGNYFSFEQNGQGLDGDNYQTGYANVSTLASWDYSTPDANSNRAWTLYPVEMARPIPTSHNYLLRHKMTGLYLHLADSYTETSHVDATTLRPVGTPFKFTATVDGGYTLKQAGSTKTLGHATSSWAAWNTSNATSATWKFVEISADGGEYYITSSKGYLGANVGEAREGAYVYTDKGRHAESVWQLVDENTLQVVPADKKVYALYNAYTNGEYSVSGDPGICTDLQAVPQQFVFHANGTDSKGTTLFRMQRAQMTNEFLSWTNNSPTSVTFNGQGSNFLFLNGSNAGYGWNSGTAPQTPYVNFVGYAGGQYTVFGDKKSTSNTGFDGYSRRSANGLLNNAQCARGANYSTTWRLRELPYVYYNLVVTGWNGAEAPTVTYSHPNDQVIAHAPQTNGGGFVVSFDALNSLSAANFTAQEMNGVPGRVELDGNTVKVTYKTDVNVTYIYKYNGVELLRKNMVVNAGADFPDVELVPQNVTYKTIPVGKVYNDVEFVVNCEFLPNWWITPSATYETANWVYLSVGSESNHKYLRYDASHPEYMSFTDSPANTDDYKWAFLVNPFTNEHKIINKAAGAGKILASVSPNGDGNTGGNTFPHFVSESDDLESMGMNRGWDFVTSYTGFFLQRKGENVGLNNRAGKLAFWTGGKDSGSTFYIVPVHDKAPVAAAHLKDSQGNVVESGKTYRLVNRQTGQVIYDGEGKWSEERFARMEGRWDSNNQKWSIIPEGNGFTVKNSGTGKYVTGNYNSSALFYYNSEGWKYYIPVGHLTDGAYTMYFFEADNVDGQKYYYISSSPTLSSTDDSGRTLLVCDNYVVFPFSSGNSTRAQWAIECTTPTETKVNYASSITSGNYYRLVSNSYNKVMTDNGGGVGIAGKADSNYAQIWQVTGSNGNYTFKNLETGKYIQGWPGRSSQWRTGDNAAKFYSGTAESGENTTFWFATVNNTSEHQSLHSAPHQSNTVVGWQASSDASKWLLEPVNVTTEMESAAVELRMMMGNDYTSQLANFFTDNACTQLKSNYASMTDAQLRSAMSALPATLREEAVRVKNNKWNDNALWNYYEKDFRIHEYEVYSSPGAWGNKLGFGDFGRLTQPTGIRVKSGEVVCILVNDDVVDGDAGLWVEMAVGTNNNGDQKALKKGYNFLKPNGDCELFITYQNWNTEKPLSAYPDIKIHIVGGTCNGAFDMNRGHTNNDWMWLKENMFKDQYLHMRSNSHVFCAYFDNMRPAQKLTRGMQMLDFVFEAENNTMSSRFNDAYYRPVITVHDVISGNPSAGNARVSWPGIKPDLFDEISFRDGGWTTSYAYPHEVGHLHQRPLWLAGTGEGSNEVLMQIYNHLWGKKTARGPQTILADRFNKEGGTAWIDNVKNGGYIHEFVQKMWYQLWLYFHQKGDDGFFSRWMECIHKRGNMENRGRSYDNPVGAGSEYMRVALAACEASQTDLYEYFKTWGFFNYAETFEGVNENGVVTISDYLTYYIKVPRKSVPAEVAQMEAWKAEMQSYSKKAPGVMFINETAEERAIEADAEVLKYFPELAGTKVENYNAGADIGCTGFFTHYGKNEADNLGFTQDGNTITITGNGAVGFKIYDNTGELIWISYWKNFTVTDAIAAGIANGTYSLVASLGDDTDLLLSGPATMYTGGTHAKSFGEATGIDENVNANEVRETKIYDLQGRQLKGLQKGVNIVNGKKIVVK